MNLKKVDKEITNEWNEIKQCCSKIGQYVEKLESSKDLLEKEITTQAIALNLHSLYTGTERIFNNIAKEIDKKPIGKSASWHDNLLKQMCHKISEVRKPVISQNSFILLNELRGFRHVVRSRYGNKLDTNKVLKLARQIPDGYRRLESEIKTFQKELPEQTTDINKNRQKAFLQNNRQLYLQYLEQVDPKTDSPNPGFFSQMDRCEKLDLKIAQAIIDEFNIADPLAIVKVRQVISQSDRALELKKTEGKAQVNQYLNRVIKQALSTKSKHESQNNEMEIE